MYILKLKELGLYEDATIIISGDHASLRGSDTMLLDAPGKNGEAFLTALFVKPSGSAGTPLQVSNAPIAQADVIPTILKSEGIQTDKDFGRAVFDVAEDEERIRTSVFHSCQNSNDYEEIIYRIKGSGRDLNNWTVIECGKYVGDIYN
jgi:arylsulfatase A-like enzyme